MAVIFTFRQYLTNLEACPSEMRTSCNKKTQDMKEPSVCQNYGKVFANIESAKEEIQGEIHTHSFESAYQYIDIYKKQYCWDHFVSCKINQILFLKGEYQKAIYSLSEIFYESDTICTNCIRLMINLIDKNKRINLTFKNMIHKFLNCKQVPKNLKLGLERILKQSSKNLVPSSIQSLVNHYQARGGIIQKVNIIQVSQGSRSVIAKQIIYPGEKVIVIPQRDIISLQKVKNSPQMALFVENITNFKAPKHSIMALFLLLQMKKGEKSPYSLYFQCFPKKIDTFPVYYGEKELSYLRGTSFCTTIKNKNRQIDYDYNQIINLQPTFEKHITLQMFKWSRMMMCSRLFGVIINNQKTQILVPIADMLNHSPKRRTNWYYSQSLQSFIVQNLKETIMIGEQLTDTYGNKSNSRFLLYYGFTIPDNRSDDVIVEVKNIKQYGNLNYRISCDLRSDDFQLMLKFFRAIVAQNQPHKYKNSKSLDLNGEYKVLSLIEQNILLKLSQYPTSISRDEKLLSNPNLCTNLRNCVRVRMGEKKVLQFYKKMCNELKKWVNGIKVSLSIPEFDLYEPLYSDLKIKAINAEY